MRRIPLRLLSLSLFAALSSAGVAHAQYVGPVNPNYPPPRQRFTPPAPYTPTPPPAPYTPPPAPYTPTYPSVNGVVTGNPSYYVDPNGIAGQRSRGSYYYDPARGWVTNTNNTTILNSATSGGRAPTDPSQIQYYNYWNGSAWVRGSRWLGQDGLWHGDNTVTNYHPNGTDTNRVVYAPNPNASPTPTTSTTRTVYSVAPSPHAPTAPAPAGTYYQQPR